MADTQMLGMLACILEKRFVRSAASGVSGTSLPAVRCVRSIQLGTYYPLFGMLTSDSIRQISTRPTKGSILHLKKKHSGSSNLVGRPEQLYQEDLTVLSVQAI